MALRDPGLENKITSIFLHSIVWSDRSVPVHKRTFWSLKMRYGSQQRERALVNLVLHGPLTGFFQCGGSIA